MTKVLILDHSKSMRKTLGERLAYEGYAIEATDDVSEASEMCRQMAFDVVLTDDSSNASPLGIPFIVLAGAGDNQIQRAVTAFRDGAMDFLQIPSDINRLYDTLRRYSEEEAPTQTPLPKQRMSAHAMGRARRTRASSVQPIIGSSNAIGNVRQVVERIAAFDTRTLITGENGTGKEMLAREIHALSARHRKEMISVDMGAITESLFESELFGHVKGAFTDAHADRPGKFEVADHSTLFLDEIGNLPYHLQAKLLTAIQRRSIVRVGSNTPVPVDIRLICATNRNLSEMADKGEFREDLLYRINTIHLEIPALRERQEDIIPLAERFIIRFCKQYGKPALRLDNAAREKLMLHPWSGNIRELEHAIEKAVIICDGAFLSAGLFQLQRRNEAPEMPTASTLEDMEKQMIRRTLDKCGGNLSAVASQLGITRQTLYNKMKKYGL